MTSRTTPRFRKAFASLPAQVQAQARLAYRLFREDPFSPVLQFKRIHAVRPVYSARVGFGYRAVGLREGDVVIWIWIGPHAEYDNLLRRI